MKIAVFANVFPALTETFVRRELMALIERGHTIKVFTKQEAPRPPVPDLEGVRVTRFSLEELKAFDPDAVYCQMGYPAHEAGVGFATQLHIPFTIRLWSGLDLFALPDRCWALYGRLTPKLCRGIIVEDAVAADWVRQRVRLQVPLQIVPNSLFLTDYECSWPGVKRQLNVVLSVARFVPKKGLIHLIRAAKQIPEMQLWLVGAG